MSLSKRHIKINGHFTKIKPFNKNCHQRSLGDFLNYKQNLPIITGRKSNHYKLRRLKDIQM